MWKVGLWVAIILIGYGILTGGCYAFYPTKHTKAQGLYHVRKPEPLRQCEEMKRYDIEVWRTQTGTCPDVRNVSAVITNYIDKHALGRGDLDGVAIIFVPTIINCDGIKTLGCSSRNGIIWVTLEGRAFWQESWTDILEHELTHMDSFIANRIKGH